MNANRVMARPDSRVFSMRALFSFQSQCDDQIRVHEDEEGHGLTIPFHEKRYEQTKPRGQARSGAEDGSGSASTSAIKVRFSAKGTPDGTVDAKDLLDVNEETTRLKKVCLEGILCVCVGRANGNG